MKYTVYVYFDHVTVTYEYIAQTNKDPVKLAHREF